MKTSDTELIARLRDAHAMEINNITTMEKQRKRLEDWPRLRQRIEAHLEETQRHATRVEQCLGLMGSGTSIIKGSFARLTGWIGQNSMGIALDEPVKICIENYAFEHFEIASYRSLQAAADFGGYAEISTIVEDIIHEEMAMADFIELNLDEVTRAYLQESATV